MLLHCDVTIVVVVVVIIISLSDCVDIDFVAVVVEMGDVMVAAVVCVVVVVIIVDDDNCGDEVDDVIKLFVCVGVCGSVCICCCVCVRGCVVCCCNGNVFSALILPACCIVNCVPPATCICTNCC